MGIWQGGRMWASAPTGVTRTRRPGKHTGLPLIPSRRGRRPRRPASTARPAPAERGGWGIRALPVPKVSPRAPRLIKAPTRNGQPSLAGGRRYALARTDPPWRSFLLDRARPVCLRPKCRRSCGGWPTTRACGRSLFGKIEKKMGGGLPGRHHGPCPRPIGRTPPFSPGGIVLQ